MRKVVPEERPLASIIDYRISLSPACNLQPPRSKMPFSTHADCAYIACPRTIGSCYVEVNHTVQFAGGADLPVYLRVTQADGNQAWTSPIYLIA